MSARDPLSVRAAMLWRIRVNSSDGLPSGAFSPAHRNPAGEVLLEPEEVAQIEARHQLGVVSHPRLLSLPSRRAKSSIWSASAIEAEKSPAA
jgi:hypothetical protein